MAYRWGSFAGGLSAGLNRGMDMYLDERHRDFIRTEAIDEKKYRRARQDKIDARDESFATLFGKLVAGEISGADLLRLTRTDPSQVLQPRQPMPMVQAPSPMAQPSFGQPMTGGLAQTYPLAPQASIHGQDIGLMGM
jgi:hypothetical protein